MKRITSNIAILYAIGGAAIYLIGWLAFPYETVKVLIDGATFGVMLMVTITWSPAAYAAIRDGAREGWMQAVVAVWLVATALLIQRTLILFLTWLHRPDWLVTSPIAGLVAYMLMVAGLIFLVSPGLSDGEVPPRNRYYLMVAGFAGSLIIGITIGANLP
ncbi:hypothetical protein LJR231_001801 [Phyllobacterium sp. LjRoot231]|uniref:hypothetical protein n=1 Tax=Phyllobacterium sp. LjRoot231 TaxID=3342289 RepID=UPI003ED0C8A9